MAYATTVADAVVQELGTEVLDGKAVVSTEAVTTDVGMVDSVWDRATVATAVELSCSSDT
jgi:hypothetical protein